MQRVSYARPRAYFTRVIRCDINKNHRHKNSAVLWELSRLSVFVFRCVYLNSVTLRLFIFIPNFDSIDRNANGTRGSRYQIILDQQYNIILKS